MATATREHHLGAEVLAAPPASALGGAAVASIAARAGVLADVATGGRELRRVVELARTIAAAGAANLLVPHALLPAVLLGRSSLDTFTTTALGERSEDFEYHEIATNVHRNGESHVATGAKTIVPSGLSAAEAVIAANHDGSVAVAVVDLDGAGVERRPVRTIGRAPDADLSFSEARAELVAVGADAAARLVRARTVATVAQAAEGLGMMERMLELLLEQGRTRMAFGRALGSFQAFQHACADIALERELAAAAVDYAASTGLWRDAVYARAFVARAAVRASRATVQLHGGKGFLDGHEAARLYRQAKQSELRWGSAGWALREIARELA